MLDALWSVKFFSDEKNTGAGFIAIKNNKLIGGDSQYYYKGGIELSSNGVIHTKVLVKRHTKIPGYQSIFGPLEWFTLKLSGRVTGDEITLNGTLQENPTQRITILCKKIDDIYI